MILFGPRALALLPFFAFLPLAAWHDRWLLIPLFTGALIVFYPFMGLEFNLNFRTPANTPHLRILTCNVDTHHLKQERLAALIEESGADVVALQECQDRLKKMLPPSWHMLQEGEFLIFSRYPLRRDLSVRPHPNMLASVISSPLGEIALYTVHLPSTRHGLTNILDHRTVLRPSRKDLLLEQTAIRKKATADVKRAAATSRIPVVVAGDFNTLVESRIYREFWKGYRNAFSDAGIGYGWTERVTIRGIRNSVRIDHVLMSKNLKALSCRVGKDVGSDHLPVIAEIAAY